ncbi:MAG TPA: Crp/Fnr family transcriptional regulator [Thermoanaerobaculia bacterium]|nr:Crp/Fnr family transcriptional regulator [Thermoanaerobaculia bacterium]
MSVSVHILDTSKSSPSSGRAAVSENRLLAALPAEDLKRLQPHLEPFSLVAGRVVMEEGEPVEWVIFPTSGLISLLVRLSDGRAVEASAIGREGMAGLPAFLGGTLSPLQGISQVKGGAFRLSAARLRRETLPGSALRALVERYTNGLLAAAAQSLACIRFHRVEERCARWLLVTHDSVRENTFELTHEFLANMLGVRRAGVSEAVGALSDRGVIRSVRGHFTIANRAGLEAASCECYRVVRQEMDAVVGLGGGDVGSLLRQRGL